MTEEDKIARKLKGYHYLQLIWRGVGVILIVLGAIKVFILRELEIGLAITALGLASYSGGVTFQSSITSLKSDERMKAIASEIFQETLAMFEDRRLGIRERELKIDYKQSRKIDVDYDKHKEILYDEIDMIIYLSFGIWKCLTYLRRLEPLIHWVNVSEQNTIVERLQSFYVELMNDLRKYRITISSEFYGHLERMLEIVSTFEVLRNDEPRIRVLRALLDNISPYVNMNEDEKY